MKRIPLLLSILLVGLLAGCGGLANEPEIIRTAALPTITPTAPPDLGYPSARVSLARGAAIFQGAQGCQACHGTDGKGNPQMQQQFVCPFPDFTDPEMARGKTVNAWFAITSNGNNGTPNCLMPPWKGR